MLWFLRHIACNLELMPNLPQSQLHFRQPTIQKGTFLSDTDYVYLYL